MKIGIVAPPWLPVPPPAYGGSEAVIDVLARGLVGAGHDVCLFATEDSTCPVPTRALAPAAPAQRMGAAAVELPHVLAAHDALRDCDVIHDHTLSGPVLASRWGRDLPPVVTTAHGPMDGELRSLYRALAGRVPVIAVSKAQAASAPVAVEATIHHGVDLATYRYGAGQGDYLCFLGRMCPEKGADRAIDIARAAGLPLRIAAKMREPAERAFFDAVIAPRLGGEIEYVGEVGLADKITLLQDARALVNPIDWPEPFGLVMIEALACGTPVLTLAAGAAPEIVVDGETGFVARRLDDLIVGAQMIGQLDRDACRRSAETRFSAARMARDHVEVYRRVVGRRLEAAVAAPAVASQVIVPFVSPDGGLPR
ncbi:MAG TPA: glycosyltransferase family 4 protein [Ilumatobacter sp.]